MPETRVIPTARSADLVTYKILVEGEELSSTNQVLSITVQKEINRIPWAKIVLLDGDPAAQDFVLSNESFFVPGKEIEIKSGYHSEEETIFKGIVIRHNLKIRSDKAQLEIECKDKAVKMSIGRKSKYFYDSKDSDILEEIIGAHGLETDVESTNADYPEMVQYRVSDWDFCITRAQANGKVCVIDDGKFSVLAPDYSQEEKMTLVYGATILDFDAEMDARNQFANVSSFGWDVANQEIVEKEANNDDVELNGNISPDELASVIELDKLELRDGSASTDAGLQDWANAKKLFNQLSKTRGRVRFQGVPDVKPNTTVVLSGVGDRFNGKVYVSAVRHQITEGNWTIDTQFGINPKWFSETVDINEMPAAGLLGAVSGLHVAKVTQIHDDPNGEYRVQVRMPIINNEEQGVWARVATLDAGDSRGSFFRPELDDEVIVGFLNDDPNDPVILGMLHSSALPSPLEPEEPNNEKGFVTRSELKFLFNDENKSIILETPGGKIITVDDDAGTIKIEDESGNVSTFDSSGITLESNGDISIKATGDVNIEGMNVGITANAEFKAEGGAGSELASSAITKVTGSLVQIN
ncbi:type VI secretion system tip protein VgrG [uncultured Draconibacterium sp.]|uniref:type VI secretion system tip protein VgrG n=1 Tax=uncultured Draconibacterium sp. TaxID=1573823 RepID=UPI0025DF4E9E|nr:type VI secretion system tip protein VgrG [uncultured Draconibacterium sp.]